MKKLFDQHIGKVVKVLPYKIGDMPLFFVLNKKGRLYKLDILKKEIIELSYTGEVCQDIKFFSHSNLPVLLICHTKSNSISFYFVDTLSKNSRTRANVPTIRTGIDPKLEVTKTNDDNFSKKNTKKWVLLYSKHYRNTLLLYNLMAKINTPNVIIGDVDIKDTLLVNFEKEKLMLFPPRDMNFGVTEYKVKDIKCLNKFFI